MLKLMHTFVYWIGPEHYPYVGQRYYTERAYLAQLELDEIRIQASIYGIK